MNTKIIWQNRLGELREHSLGVRVSEAYARDLFRWSILECQGIMSRDERRNSKLCLLRIVNAIK